MVLGLKPEAQAWIVDFRFGAPEIWRESTLDTQVIELQFNCFYIFWEIATDVGVTYMQP